MREIEFRGKDKETGEWGYGYYRVNSFHKDAHIDYAHSAITWDIKPETVGQYTGQNDKNGVKIFEGDIVKTDLEFEPYLRVDQIKRVAYYTPDPNKTKYDPVQHYWGAFVLIGKNDQYPLYAYHNIRVIGNIHDNPELLEEINGQDSARSVKWGTLYGL